MVTCQGIFKGGIQGCRERGAKDVVAHFHRMIVVDGFADPWTELRQPQSENAGQLREYSGSCTCPLSGCCQQSVWSRAGRLPPFPMPETDFRGLKPSNLLTARQAMTVVSLELRARYGAWFRCAGDS